MADPIRSNELYYQDKPGGRKRDAELHETLLDTRSGDLISRLQSFHSAVIDDFTDSIVAQNLFQISIEDLKTDENKTVVRRRSAKGLKSFSLS